MQTILETIAWMIKMQSFTYQGNRAFGIFHELNNPHH